MKTTTIWGTLLLTAFAACGQVRQTPAPPFDIADVLRAPSAVAPRQKSEPRWVRIDSAESRTLWLDTAGIERAGTDTFTVLTAFRFAKPRPSRSRGRTYVEARLRHQVECADRRMRTLEFDTRDATGSVVDSGRVDSQWLRPMEGSGYANLINLVCDFEGYPAAKRPEPEEQDSMAKRKPDTAPANPPQPIVYSMDFSVPISLVAFREQDAVQRARYFGDALVGLIDATAGEAFAMGEATVTVRSAEPLPLAQ